MNKVTEAKKVVRELKRQLVTIACNLSTVRSESVSLASYGLLEFLELLCSAGGVPESQQEAEDGVNKALHDPVAITAVVNTLYNLTHEAECCALMSNVRCNPTSAVTQFVLAAVGADSDSKVYDDDVVHRALVAAVNVTEQAAVAGAMVTGTSTAFANLAAIAAHRELPGIRVACATAIANMLTHTTSADKSVPEAVITAVLAQWHESVSASNHSGAACNTLSYIVWLLSRAAANKHTLVAAGVLNNTAEVVAWLHNRGDASITNHERDAMLWEIASTIHAVCAVEVLRPSMFDNDK